LYVGTFLLICINHSKFQIKSNLEDPLIYLISKKNATNGKVEKIGVLIVTFDYFLTQ